MSSFAFPVFVHEKDDDSVMEFLTFTSMQGYLEAVDVENGEYEAWDADGRCLELGVGKTKSEWLKITLRQGRASDEEFAALKKRAEKRSEFEPFSKRLLRRLADSKWRKINS
jgi:hypothetical protein